MKPAFNTPAEDFGHVHEIQSRNLPVIGDADPTHFVRLTAKRMPNDEWNLAGFHSLPSWTPGLQKMQDVYIAVINRHHGDPPPSVGKIVICEDFDEAFMIMRDMEESILKHLGLPPTPEPEQHFMWAYRRLGRERREKLDRLHFERLREKGPVLPRARPPAGSKPAF